MADDIALIGIDWGTTNRRAWAFAADGRIVDEKSDAAGKLFAAVSASGAAADYQAADDAASASMRFSVKETQAAVQGAAHQAMLSKGVNERADAAVLGAAGEDRLVNEQDFNLEALGRAADKDEVLRLMLQDIENRKAAVATLKKALGKPDLIFGNEEIFRRSLESQGIVGKPVLEKILWNHRKDEQWKDLVADVAQSILFIILGFLTEGAGFAAFAVAGAETIVSTRDLLKAQDNFSIENDAFTTGVTHTPANPMPLILSGLGAALDATEFGMSFSKLAWKSDDVAEASRMMPVNGSPQVNLEVAPIKPPKETPVKKTVKAPETPSVFEPTIPRKGPDGKFNKSNKSRVPRKINRVPRKIKKYRKKQQSKERIPAVEKNATDKLETGGGKSVEQGVDAVQTTGEKSSELEKLFEFAAKAVEGAKIATALQEIHESGVAIEEIEKAAKTANEIIAKGKQLGLGERELLPFLTQLRNGVPVAKIEAAMKVAAKAMKAAGTNTAR